MNIFKDRFNCIVDEYNKNINMILNTFTEETSIFLFVKDIKIIENSIINMISDYQIYNDIKYLEKIYESIYFNNDIKIVIILVDLEVSNLLNKVTYIYCNSTIKNVDNMNIIMSRNLTPGQAKKLSTMVKYSRRPQEFYNYIINNMYTVVYRKSDIWEEILYEGDFNRYDKKYKYLGSETANKINIKPINTISFDNIIKNNLSYENNREMIHSIDIPIMKIDNTGSIYNDNNKNLDLLYQFLVTKL